MLKRKYIIYSFTILFLCQCNSQNQVPEDLEDSKTNTIQDSSSIVVSDEKLQKQDSNQGTIEPKSTEEEIQKESLKKVISNEKQQPDSLLSYTKNKREAADALVQEADAKNKSADVRLEEADAKNKSADIRLEEADAKNKLADAKEIQAGIKDKKAKELLNSARLSWLKEMAVYITLFLSIVAAFFLSIFLQKIYMWRKKINGNAIILPEEVRDEMDNSRKEIKMLLRKIAELSSISTRNNNLNSEYFNDINEALKPLKDTISSQRDEIKRLQKGYDNHIKKSFVRRLIDLRDRVSFYTKKENKSSSEVIEATTNILKIVDYTFKTEGIKTISFKSGSSLKNLDADEVDILEDNAVESKDSKLAGTIKDTLSPCYYLEGSDGRKEVIKKGMVAFYKNKGN